MKAFPIRGPQVIFPWKSLFFFYFSKWEALKFCAVDTFEEGIKATDLFSLPGKLYMRTFFTFNFKGTS